MNDELISDILKYLVSNISKLSKNENSGIHYITSPLIDKDGIEMLQFQYYSVHLGNVLPAFLGPVSEYKNLVYEISEYNMPMVVFDPDTLWLKIYIMKGVE